MPRRGRQAVTPEAAVAAGCYSDVSPSGGKGSASGCRRFSERQRRVSVQNPIIFLVVAFLPQHPLLGIEKTRALRGEATDITEDIIVRPGWLVGINIAN